MLRNIHGVVQYAEHRERPVVVSEHDDVARFAGRDAARAGVAKMEQMMALVQLIALRDAAALRVGAKEMSDRPKVCSLAEHARQTCGVIS